MSVNKPKKRKKKQNKKAFFVLVVLLIVSVFIALYIFTSNSRAGLSTETVMIGTAEDKTSVTGYIMRDEMVINAPEAGVISFRADEGKRVSKGSAVAVVYSGDVSDEVKNELSSIHKRINEIEGSSVEKNLYAGDTMGGTSQIENDIDMIVSAVYSGNVSAVTHYKDDIIRIIRKDTGEGAVTQTTLEKLKAQKRDLESSISGKSTVMYASRAGIMCSQIDGCEEYFNVKNIDTITPSYLNNSPKESKSVPDKVEKDAPCLKIINNYQWYFTAIVDEKWVEDMKVGNSVALRFTDISDDTMDGTVYSISDAENGKVAIVVESHSLFSGIYTTRIVNAEIIRKTYNGFKVSKDAVHIDEDGGYYVYVSSEGIIRRRDVNILYSDEAYVIIKEDNSASNNLLLYDEVVISGTGIKEGSSI